MAAKHDQSKTKQQSSVANSTSTVTKTITDSMNTTLNYVTNVTNSAPAGAGGSSLLPIVGLVGAGLLMLVFLFLKR